MLGVVRCEVPLSQSARVVAPPSGRRRLKSGVRLVMIGDVLLLLRDRLNAYLRDATPASDSAEDPVQLIDGEQSDPIVFRLNALTVLLVNIEQEATQRTLDALVRTQPDGNLRQLLPEVRLNLYVLFAARFKAYEHGLNQLAMVIRFFQQHRAMDHDNTPGLNPLIDKLVLELVTLPISEQNEIWSALRVGYHPSVLFRVRMLVFRDADGAAVPKVSTTVIRAAQRV